MAFDTDGIRRSVSITDTAARFGIRLKANSTGHRQEWWGCCPFHAEDTASFSVFPAKNGHQRFYCFGCHANGDVIDFVREIKGVSLPEACEILGGQRDVPDNRPALFIDQRSVYDGIEAADHGGEHPFKIHASTKLFNPKRGEWGSFRPEMVHEYRDKAGSLTGLVLRRRIGDRKETPMVRYVRMPDGTECWARVPFERPRSLYRLHELGDAAQVIVVEGEKAADALRVYTGRIVLSWPGGTNALHYVDWSPLRGRNVVLWADFDQAGSDAMQAVAERIAGLCTVRIVDIFKPRAA